MRLVFKVLKSAKKYYKHLILSLFFLLVMNITQLVSPQIIRKFLNLIEVRDERLLEKSIYYALLYLLVCFLSSFSTGMRTYLSHVAAWNYVHDIRVKLYDHIQRLSLKFYHDKQTGQLMSRILSDTSVMELFIAHAAPEILNDFILLIGVLVILFTMNKILAITSVLVVPFIFGAVWVYSKKVRPLFKDAHQKFGELSACVQDNISGIKEIQVFNRQDFEFDRVWGISNEDKNLRLDALKKSAMCHPSINFFNRLGTVFVIAVGGILAARGQIQGSEIVAFVLYLNVFFQPINDFARLSEDLQNSLAAAERVFELLSEESDVKEKENAIDIGRCKGNIEFKNVCFSYRDNVPVLKDLNLSIKEGQTIALVGPTGVGKTTIASLIARFYDPASGQILLDGHDLRDISLASLRDNISMVLQDVFLFNGTVAENIAYGSENVTMEDIKRAAKIANADEFIEKMDNGYDTIIGERGIKLSGGQKQRISIARAILRNRPILILDEATAAVDNTTERLIHEAIDNVIKDKTTIIIAHRLSTIKNADKIAVIQDGNIAEIGTHDELIKKNGIYASLYNE